MADIASPARSRDREAWGFLASLVFTALAAVRDVYFAGVFQQVSPLLVVVVAFSLWLAVRETILGVAAASLLLVVGPIYVNQVGIALASPLTVRVALAVGPALIFVLQLVERRLSPSPYSLTCAVAYGGIAITTAALRRRALSTIILPSEDRGCHASRHPAGSARAR